MNKEKLQEQINKSWISKSKYDYDLMCNVDNHLTWDEYHELSNLHVEYEEGCENLGFTLPYHI